MPQRRVALSEDRILLGPCPSQMEAKSLRAPAPVPPVCPILSGVARPGPFPELLQLPGPHHTSQTFHPHCHPQDPSGLRPNSNRNKIWGTLKWGPCQETGPKPVGSPRGQRSLPQDSHCPVLVAQSRGPPCGWGKSCWAPPPDSPPGLRKHAQGDTESPASRRRDPAPAPRAGLRIRGPAQPALGGLNSGGPMELTATKQTPAGP